MGYPLCNEEIRLNIVPWLHEAGNPYWDWLWGSSKIGRSQLFEWLRRSNSEISVNRVRCLRISGRLIGGYIALASSELKKCRKADFLAVANCVRRSQHEGMMMRIRQSRSIFSGVSEDAFYLSRIGVGAADRGRGFGHSLLEMFIEESRAQGISRLHLDVSADKPHAIHLYRSSGFELVGSSSIPEAGMFYHSMSKVL